MHKYKKMETEHKTNWEQYREAELAHAERVAAGLGFILDERQVHIGGERYLMTQKRDVGGGGLKLVLLGKRTGDGKCVVIKFSTDPDGMSEIESEHTARHLITNLDFAYHAFAAPEELLYKKDTEHAISVSAYIEQESVFLSRTKEEQFTLALRSFKTQEGVHATTYAHAKKIQGALGMIHAEDYLSSFADFTKEALLADKDATLAETLDKASQFLRKNKTTIEQYCDFLTHSDFVPHNLRIVDSQIYLLDYASIHFGNKHESWARFLNFMMLYNPELEQALLQYVKDNRSEEEYLSLRLMRTYKLGFLLSFYAGQLDKASGNLRLLAKERITFWTKALEATLEDRPLNEEALQTYKQSRDTLRSEEERERQRELH